MQSKENKNAILAVILSGLILFGWNYFFPTAVYEEVQSPVVENTKSEINGVKNNRDNSVEERENSISQESVTLSVDEVSFEIDSNLNIIKAGSLNSFEDLDTIFKVHKLELFADKTKLNFLLTATSPSTASFRTSDSKLNGTVELNKKGYIEFKLNSAEGFVPRFSLTSISDEMDDGQKFNSFVLLGESLESVKVGEDDLEQFEGKFNWFGLDYKYHIFSLIIDNKLMYKAQTQGTQLLLEPLQAANNFNYKVVFLKKNYDDLKNFGFQMSKAVDFGMWELIAVPILRGLQFFYEVLQNYGLSIIILTIIIRLLTFPLQYKSFKSMKKMQVIQPELKRIKEKYKDNPQKVQQETMALFKKAGANPLGGCLPMLLQMPVFFAFYKVLFTSVELVDAPFYFWITDLSEKDPFYILPVLMGIAMWLNMKLTPNTSMDPAQQKVMMFMPIMFSLFMLNLPAGLTLYILVSTIVGMLQQLLVYRSVDAKAA